jgi:hypothetical protein
LGKIHSISIAADANNSIAISRIFVETDFQSSLLGVDLNLNDIRRSFIGFWSGLDLGLGNNLSGSRLTTSSARDLAGFAKAFGFCRNLAVARDASA